MGKLCLCIFASALGACSTTALHKPEGNAGQGSSIAIDFSNIGVAYDGIGSLSGGGGDTRLLIDYPPAIQQDILDILFKPNAGASLQYIKVEIGGDSQSTEGVEMSHEHWRGDLNCTRGYEWYVMSEAKKRNPGIKTYGLSWGAPGWIGNGNYYSDDNIQYHLDWIYCAEAYWGIHIDYMGIWNERQYNGDWIKQLRASLDAAVRCPSLTHIISDLALNSYMSSLMVQGYVSTRIVAADGDWSIVDSMVADPELAAAIDIVGAHYPGAAPPSAGLALNKTFWASEMWNLGVHDNWNGAGALASDLARFSQYGLSSSIVWCLIYSWYGNLAYGQVDNTNSGKGHSLMTAAEPWSGYYEINPTLAVIAHWTQFTQRGWHYLQVGSGIGNLSAGGSYATVWNGHVPGTVLEFSVILQTMGVATAQDVTFQLSEYAGRDLPPVLHVWQTNQSNYFVQQADVAVNSDGTVSVSIPADSMVSLTTTTGQGWVKPVQPIPASQPFPFPYADNFNSYTDQSYALYFSDMGGVWQTAPIPASLQKAKGSAQFDASDLGYNQLVTTLPIAWVTNPNPFTCIGNPNSNAFEGVEVWTDYNLTVLGAFDSANDYNVVTFQNNCNAKSATQQFLPLQGDLVNTPALLQSIAQPTQCLAITGSDPIYSGAMRVALVPCNSTSPAPAIWLQNATTLQIASAGMCLDVLSANTSVGTRTIAWPCETPAGRNEVWMVNPAGSAIQLVAQETGLCVDLESLAANGTFLWITARMTQYAWNPVPDAYSLYLYQSPNATAPGTWALTAGGTTLRHGTTPTAVNSGAWYTMSLVVKNTTITAYLNGAQLTALVDTTYAFGNAAIGSGWHSAWYDDFSITAV